MVVYNNLVFLKIIAVKTKEAVLHNIFSFASLTYLYYVSIFLTGFFFANDLIIFPISFFSLRKFRGVDEVYCRLKFSLQAGSNFGTYMYRRNIRELKMEGVWRREVNEALKVDLFTLTTLWACIIRRVKNRAGGH